MLDDETRYPGGRNEQSLIIGEDRELCKPTEPLMASFVSIAFEILCFEERYDTKILVELAPETVT